MSDAAATILIEKAKELAIQAVKKAGTIARERFGRFEHLAVKDSFGDVVTEVDHLAEAIILDHIRRVFPDHRIHSEEAGENGLDSDWLWLVDPLDGTNNYAIGLPVFTISITLMHRNEPVLGVIYEPIVDRLFVSGLGQGAFCNDAAIRVKKALHLGRGNIGWIQGHQVGHDSRAVNLRQHIDVSFKRMIRLWAPTLQWCMLARGDLDGIVLFNSEGDDLYSGILMVKEAGGAVVDFQGKPFSGMKEQPYLIACHPDHVGKLVTIVQEGLS